MLNASTQRPLARARRRTNGWRWALRFAVAMLGAMLSPAVDAQITFRAASAAAVPAVPVLRGAGVAASAASGNLTPALPAGTQAGDFVLCLVESRDTVAHALPAGWTQIAQAATAPSHRASLWGKIAVAGEPAPTVSHSAGGPILAQTVGFTGVDPVTPLLAPATFTASPADQTTEGTGYNVNVAGVPFFTWVFTGHIGESYNGYTVAAGGPFYTSVNSEANFGNTRLALFAYYDVRNAGVQPNAQSANNPPFPRNAPSHGALLALRPAAAGGLTIATPAGTIAGDVMIASVIVQPSATAVTAPAGWTLAQRTVQPAGGTDSSVLSTYYRVAVVGEPASHTWTFAPAAISGAAGGILSFAGVNVSAPVHVGAGNTTPSGFVHTANGVTTTLANTMLISAHAFPSASTFTPPAGMTEAVDLASVPAPNTAGVTLEMNYKPQPTAGATGAMSATAASTGTDAGAGAAQLIALQPVSGPDHYLVTHAVTGINCQPENVTIFAHTGTHTAIALTNSTTITVAALFVSGSGGPGGRGDWTLVSGGGTLDNGVADDGVAAYTFPAAGASSVVLALRNTWAQTVNIAVSDGVATDTSGTASGEAGFNQNLTFSAAGFRFVDTLDNAIPSQVAGVPSGTLRLQAIQSGACGATGACTGACTAASGFGAGSNVTVELASECVNPTSCQAGQLVSITNNGTSAIASNNGGSVAAYSAKALVFAANGAADFALNYPDVGSIRLHARYNLPLGTGSASSNFMTGASAPFTVKPHSFRTSGVVRDSDLLVNPAAANATGPAFIRAGDAFRATVTAVNAAGNPTPNYGREVSPEGARLIATLAGGLGLTNSPAITNPSAFGAFSAGAASGTTFSWGEVGIITLSAGVADGDYLGAGEAMVFTQSGDVGRFVPHHFALSGASLTNRTAAGCAPASVFTYMGEGVGLAFTLTAVNAAGVTTQNYASANGFAKLPSAPGTLAPASTMGYGAVSGGTDLSARIDTSVSSSVTWSAGVANVGATIAIARAGAPDGPYAGLSVGIAPSDQDAVGLSAASMNLDVDGVGGGDHALVGVTEVRFGRLRVFSAVGSQLANLPVPLETQYFNGVGFITNGEDSCTTLAKSAVIFTNFQRNLAACETGSISPPAGLSFSRGKAGLTLGKPGPGAGADTNAGSVDLKPRLSAAETGNSCVNGTAAAATDAGQPWLQYQWSGAGGYDQNPTGRASFGQARNSTEFIYFRENY